MSRAQTDDKLTQDSHTEMICKKDSAGIGAISLTLRLSRSHVSGTLLLSPSEIVSFPPLTGNVTLSQT